MDVKVWCEGVFVYGIGFCLGSVVRNVWVMIGLVFVGDIMCVVCYEF